MGLFSSSTEKSVAGQYPNNPDITRQYGSGAEQDRYGAHFGASTAKIEQGINKGVDKLKEAAMYQGQGAEQDRYNTHFSPAAHGVDRDNVRKAAESLMEKARGNTKYSNSFGLGYDGQRMAGILAAPGSGAEQDNYAGHFGLDRRSVENAAKRVQEGARNVLDKK
ncbi:hypothetical protein DE146DRAFT_750754 [Phaeosphaeria sp. MPI-PUGE-AT-0046c]|nr:hypothetical protein DE146DRAFT_750754 [Phaeosphaeria sp. MPI-PUGE-AT-0046c]